MFNYEDYNLSFKKGQTVWIIYRDTVGYSYPTVKVVQRKIYDICFTAKKHKKDLDELYLRNDKGDIFRYIDSFHTKEEAIEKAKIVMEKNRQWFRDIYIPNQIQTYDKIIKECLENFDK